MFHDTISSLVMFSVLAVCRHIAVNRQSFAGVILFLPEIGGLTLLSVPESETWMFAPLVDKQPRAEFNDGSQDMSEFLTQRDNAESGKPQTLPWLSAGRGVDASAAPCIPDTDLKLEWIHGYSAQVTMSQVLQLYYVVDIVAQHELNVLLRIFRDAAKYPIFFPARDSRTVPRLLLSSPSHFR